MKRNTSRFPERYMFQLTKKNKSCVCFSLKSQIVILNEDEDSLKSQIVTLNEDEDSLKSQIVTLNNFEIAKCDIKFSGKTLKYLSYAFTEQGVASHAFIRIAKRNRCSS